MNQNYAVSTRPVTSRRKNDPATFDGGTLSSDGDLLILREIEKKLGLATVLSRHIPDDRNGRRVRHSYSDMTRARMFAIVNGHEDCQQRFEVMTIKQLRKRLEQLPVVRGVIDGPNGTLAA